MNREREVIKKKVAQLIRKYQNDPKPWRPEYPLGELYSWLIDRDKKESPKGCINNAFGWKDEILER